MTDNMHSKIKNGLILMENVILPSETATEGLAGYNSSDDRYLIAENAGTDYEHITSLDTHIYAIRYQQQMEN